METYSCVLSDRTGDAQDFRAIIEELANQLCVVVDEDFDFRLSVDAHDETVEKLQMLINFVLDAARRKNSDLQQKINEIKNEIALRCKTEEALEFERDLFETLMEHIPDSIYFKDLDSKFYRINKGLSDHIRLPKPDEAMGTSDFDYFEQEYAQKAYNEEQQIINYSKAVVNIEERELLQDGREYWMSTTKMPLTDREGRVIGTFGISRNITEMKQSRLALEESESKFRTLVEASPDSIIMLDRLNRIELVNHETERMFGYSRDELIGKPIHLLIPTNVTTSGEYHGLKHSRKQFPIEVNLSSYYCQNQKMKIITVRDISSRKLLQQEFDIAREIQESLLPKSAPQVKGYDIASLFSPAESTGGDFYDFIRFEHGTLGIIVGDVSGHGFGPAILTAATRSYIKASVKINPCLSHIFCTTNNLIFQDTNLGRFITAILVEIDTIQNKLSYVSAGHIDGLILNHEGKVKHRLKSTACPLGLFDEFEYPTADQIPLESGDILLLLTDGFLETFSDDAVMFGMEGILKSIQTNCEKNSKDMLYALHQDVLMFQGSRPQLDDLTGVLVKVD